MAASLTFALPLALWACSRPAPAPEAQPAMSVAAHPARPSQAQDPAQAQPQAQPQAGAQGQAQPQAQAAAGALVVESPPRTAPLEAGAEAPVFRATAHDGRVVESRPGARERIQVVYFYPRDETPGCTLEANDFREDHAALQVAGADVVGVSTDDDASHRAFAQHHGLPFALVSDPQGRLASAFGVEVRNGYIRRATFVIDRRGRVARAFPNVQVQGHSDEVAAAVRAAAGGADTAPGAAARR